MKRSSELSLTAVPFAWMGLLFAVPTAIVCLIAFRATDLYGVILPEYSLEAFRSLWNSYILELTWRTLWVSAITTVGCIALSLPVVYCLARSSSKWQTTWLMLLVLPFWISFIIRVFAWKSILHPEGWVKQVLVVCHLVEPDAILLYNPAIVVLVMIYNYLPFALLPMYAAAEGFDFRLCEAGMDLGLSKWRTFWQVFVPGISSGISTAVLMVLVPAIGAYVIPEVVGGTSSELLGNRIVQKCFVDRNLPEASALSILLTLGVIVPYGLYRLRKRRTSE